MPFEVSELQEEDCAEFATLDAIAMQGWSIARAMEKESLKKGETRQQMIEGWMRKSFEQKNPNSVWLKVTDIETGEMVSAACWSWQLEQSTPKSTKVDVPAPAEVEGVKPKEEPPSVFAAMREDWAAFKNEFFASQAYFNLSVLVTHPRWQRKGAGGMLVKYGCDKADQVGLICVLQASEQGLGLYLKHGFEIVKETQLDLRPFEIDESELRRSMIRQPKSGAL